jgi:hypothetical protein
VPPTHPTKQPAVVTRTTVLLEKSSPSPSQGSPRILWNPTTDHIVHKSPRPVPALRQINSLYALPTDIKIHFNNILPHPSQYSKRSLLQVCPSTPCIHLTSPPYVPRSPPISFFSILSPEKHFVGAQKVNLLTAGFFSSPVTSFLGYSRTSSVHPLLSTSETKTHANIKQLATLRFCYIHLYVFGQQTERTKNVLLRPPACIRVPRALWLGSFCAVITGAITRR